MRSRAAERAYYARLMNDPEEKAKLRLEACGRHALIVFERLKTGKYKDYSFRDFVIEVKGHSDSIDDWFNHDGWRKNSA